MTKPLIGIGADVLVPTSAGERQHAFAFMTYIDALIRAGAIPVVVPPQPANVTELIDGLDGVLLAGGNDCDPALYGEEPLPGVEVMDVRRQSGDTTLAAVARERRVPTLGICLGMQVMNVVAGGSLMQDIATQHETRIQHVSPPHDRLQHEVAVGAGTRLASIIGAGEITVNSSHHQAVRTLGRGLRESAIAPDGIVEGVEDPEHPFYLGVQWHPEDMPGDASAETLFGAFVAAARHRAETKRGAAQLSPAGSIAAE